MPIVLAAAATTAWTPYVEPIQVISGVATTAAAVFAFVTLIAIYGQSRHSAQIARETTAMEAYKEYMKLCMDMPEFGSSQAFKAELKTTDLSDLLVSPLTSKREKGLAFLSYTLFAMEQIMDVAKPTEKHNHAWLAAVWDQIAYHQETLKATWSEWSRHYGDRLRVEVDFVLGMPLRPDGGLDYRMNSGARRAHGRSWNSEAA